MSLIGTLGSGVSALSSFGKGLEVIGDNIANVNTTGFKASRATYSDSFSNTLERSSSSPASLTMQIGMGVNLQSVTANFGQGSLTTTGRTTDLGIAGDGFFMVRDSADSSLYATRAGDFRIDEQGYLVNPEGLRVQGLTGGSASFSAIDNGGNLSFTSTGSTLPSTVGDIQINFALATGSGVTNDTGGAFTDAEVDAAVPALENFSIDQSGMVNLYLTTGDTFAIGQVLLKNFREREALVRQGGNLYTNFDAAGPIGGVTVTPADLPGTNGLGKIQSGTLELSNVDLANEFANLITTQRSFQAGSRLITVSDDVLEEVVNLKR